MALKQLLALTTIMLTVQPGQNADPEKGIAARRPKTKEIPMNARFKAMNEDQEKELIDMKAAREMTKEEIGEADHGQLIDAATEADNAKAVSDREDAAAKSKTAENEIDSVRADYEEVFGEAPNGNMKIETMKTRIAEKREADEKATADIV